MSVFEEIESRGHEQVVFCSDTHVGFLNDETIPKLKVKIVAGGGKQSIAG